MKCFVCKKTVADDTELRFGKIVCDGCEPETFTQENMCLVSYAAIREAQGDEPHHMSLTDGNEVAAVIAAVNVGIDSRLQAITGCDFSAGKRTIDGKPELVLCITMECSISVEALPVLLRRLFDGNGAEGDKEIFDAGMSLAGSMMMVLGFDDTGNFVGREGLD